MAQKMRLSVETYVMRERFGDEATIRMIKDAGFDAFDYSLFWASAQRNMLGEDYRERAIALRKVADAIGIVCNQAHAPFAFAYADTIDLSNQNYLELVRSIEVAAILGAENIIVHCLHPMKLPEGVDFYDYNTRFYRSLLPYCEKFGIHICVENLFQKGNEPVLCDPEKLQKFVKDLDSEWFRICIDVGHLSITGFDPAQVIQMMDPDLLKALHVHDNNYQDDAHWLPYCGRIKWDEITKALKQMGYSGDFTFEITGYLDGQDSENLPAALKFAEQTGRLLMKKIENA